MEQCNGTTQKGDRCKRNVKVIPGDRHIVDGKVYCTVHVHRLGAPSVVRHKPVPKPARYNNHHYNNHIPSKYDNPHDQANKKKIQILARVPADLYDTVKDLTLEELQIIFPSPEDLKAKNNPYNNKINYSNDDNDDEFYADIIANLNMSQGNFQSEITSEPAPIIDEDTNEDKDKLFECSCCYCENFVKNRVTCSEKHEFCTDCLSRYVTDRVTGGDYKLKCMADRECPGIFNHRILKKILDPKLYRTYADKETQEVVTMADMNDIYTCPKCVVYCAILDTTYKDMQKEPRFECLNLDCKFLSCYKCKQEFHGNTDCNYNKLDKDVRKTIEEILTRNRTRSCAKCKKEFLRTDGCNKMTCSCKALSCYICRVSVKDYTHFHNDGKPGIIGGKCPLYTNETEVEKMSFASALNEIYETYKSDEVKLFDEVYPVLSKLEKEHIKAIDAKFGKPKQIRPVPVVESTKINVKGQNNEQGTEYKKKESIWSFFGSLFGNDNDKKKYEKI